MSMNLQYLVHFIKQEFLEIIYYTTRVQNDKQRNLKTTSSGRGEGSVWAHQKDPPHNGLFKHYLQQG